MYITGTGQAEQSLSQLELVALCCALETFSLTTFKLHLCSSVTHSFPKPAFQFSKPSSYEPWKLSNRAWYKCCQVSSPAIAVFSSLVTQTHGPPW
jgi:hypothetical protein